MQTVKITVIVLFNDVVNFAPKFALNYLHFAFFAYLNLVHILLHDKICAKLLFSLIFACVHFRPLSSNCVHFRPIAFICVKPRPTQNGRGLTRDGRGWTRKIYKFFVCLFVHVFSLSLFFESIRLKNILL